MERFRFEFMDKSLKDMWLPQLFGILHDNMSKIAPSGMGYEEERQQWLAAVSPAMDKDPRKIILMFAQDQLAGYFQYYVNGDMFMVEEIQILPEHWGTTLLYALFRLLGTVLPAEIKIIGAYAHESNVRSRAIMRKLGMEQAEEKDGVFCYYQGAYLEIRRKYSGRK